MLSGLFKSKEEKIREQIEIHIKEGLRQLESKFFNKAMIDFDKAMDLDKEAVYPRLVEELHASASSGQMEAALAIGLNLLKVNHADYELANKLGNYAREIGDYKQASELYKRALKVNKNYEIAFYNLAAAMAKVDIYDEAVKSAVSIFDGHSGFVFPEYLGEPDLFANLSDIVKEKKEERVNAKIQSLEDQKKEKENTGDKIEVDEIVMKIKDLKASLKHIGPKDFIVEFEEKITDDPGNNDPIYNLGLYCVSNGLPKKGLEIFKKLPPKQYERLELLQAIAYAELGKVNGAIKLVTRLLGENEYNRYNNVNIGMMYKKAGKRFLAVKYLIKTASLLDKSGGIYSMSELVDLAHEKYKDGKLKASLGFFEIASTENPDPNVWKMIGIIFVEIKKYDDAVYAFRQMLALDPNSKAADDKLKEIHDYYCGMTDQLMSENKYAPAASYYEKALSVVRNPETIKATAGVYKLLGNSERETELTDELQQLEEEEKQRIQEMERQKHIAEGKEFLKTKNYQKAIQSFENALRMKVDKNVFVQLSALYKGLKKHSDLQSLVSRWEKMLEHEEKVKRFEKAQAREKSGGA
ncbi:MAG: tetratricopeptide repeat protein [Proteobacteria bacterium]|nr:tetratricopeptide repeat protein [Pseudomonadota bacterium]